MNTKLTEPAVLDESKIAVWNWQIFSAMPKFEKLHIVAENVFAILKDQKCIDDIQEVNTNASGVWFSLLFRKNIYGRDMKKLLEFVDVSWIDVKNGYLELHFNSDDLKKPYLEDDSESS
jgi:hypothetical protein